MSLIVIRHSNREKIISSRVNGLTANLTHEGIRNAKVFGKQLKDKLDVDLDYIITTHVQRCIDTGNLINSEHNSRTTIYNYDEVESMVKLGYVIPENKILFLNYFDEMCKSKNVNYPLLFNSLYKNKAVCYKDCNEYSRNFISKFYIPCRNNLIVAHDVNVAPMMHFLSETFKFPLEKDMIKPKPLCGFQFTIYNYRE